MNDYSAIGLYDHNIDSYEKIKHGLLIDYITAIVHATGTGKSYNALQLAYDNKDKKIMYIVPSNSIIEHLKEIIEENPNLDLDRDFPNLEFRTYQSLINLSKEELSKLDIDILIIDEFHHIGAPVWGARINTIVETHENIKILGMTAYTVRDRGTSYERDMVNPDGNELFSGKVVSTYDLCDAMIDGVLPKPVYKSGYVYLEKTADELEQRIENIDHNSKDYKELSPMIKDVKKRLHDALSVKDIFKINIKNNGKYIYFCPLGVEEGKNDIDTIMEEAKTWIKEMGLSEDEYEFYVSTSEMGEEGKKNRKAFYNDEDLEGNKTNNKLRIMFAINQYNEGVHAPGLDGVIMGRGTQSDIIFFEQLGRALSVRGKTKEEYDELYLKTLEELIELCKQRQIKINDINSKEEIIEQLLAPIIIDLANNIGFIKDLENQLKDRVKEIQNSGLGNKRIVHLGNTAFDIDMINEDLLEILNYMNDRLTMTWEDKYNLAKTYYEHYGNLKVPHFFKTLNGIDFDENGFALGKWLARQKLAYNGKGSGKISERQIKLLEEIGMIFENSFDMEWTEKYNLAKAYYEHHGNLKVPHSFKTLNGIDFDENGISLGHWICGQRNAFQGKGTYKITKEKIKLLEEIGMIFENVSEAEWTKKYNLAKAYYEHYGNLEISSRFKTINGYEYDENGVTLGIWICGQRDAFQGKGTYKITKEKIKLLEEIGMRFQYIDTMVSWMKKYELAKAYYEHYGNLKVSQSFKTLNGIDFDENGIALGNWISNLRQVANKKMRGSLSQEQLQLLGNIGMIWNEYEDEWTKKYELAKAYYEHYGDLKIPTKFKTKNGYEYDENGIPLGSWLHHQRQAIKKNGRRKITKQQIELLRKIGLPSELLIIEDEWTKKYELAKAYYEHYGNLKIPYSFKTLNGIDFDEDGIALGLWIFTQRSAYKGREGEMKLERINLLEKIGMKWFNEKIDNRLQTEDITEKNIDRKYIEILNRTRTLLNQYQQDTLPSKDEINQGMLDKLNHTPKRK